MGMAFFGLLLNLKAASVTNAYTYKSTLTSDGGGPLDLVAELNYDGGRSNAPIAVVMHGYSGTSGKPGGGGVYIAGGTVLAD